MRASWSKLTIAKKLYTLFGIMAVLILIELLTLKVSMQSLSAVRAFVGGEGHWAKSHNEAIFQLQRYAMTGDENYFRKFHEELKVIEGDRMGRLELEKPNPDMNVVREGFIAGQIHPEDIDSMVKLLQRFDSVYYIREAVRIWRDADSILIPQLLSLGDEYRVLISTAPRDREKLRQLDKRLEALNDDLMKATVEFSGVLGEGSRWLENIVLLILLSLVVTVESVGLTITFLTSRDISKRMNELVNVSEHIGAGSFSERVEVQSEDEIGKLQAAVNKMGTLLDTSYRDLEEKIEVRTKELTAVATLNKHLYKEAQDAVRTQNEFLSIASHELRTPVTALGLQVEMIQRNLSNNELDEEKLKEQIDNALMIHRRLSALLGVLTDLTKISIGKIDLQMGKLDLSHHVRAVIQDLLPLASSQKIQFDLAIEDQVHGTFDPVRVGQVVTNLINNAIKYGKGSPVQVKLVKDSHHALITVRDQGTGIAPDQLEKIFERYERGSEELTIGGLGLGLYIGREIVRAHGGDITVVSSPGAGAEFTVRLPL